MSDDAWVKAPQSLFDVAGKLALATVACRRGDRDGV